ncbi:hypothetical protein AGR7C_Lc210005 [Agrobacterium deltaense Zutra 3/1]|uniref:Uncharacterized protein n=1 Tax=Agrobacterium deltaense Zutra 3/1 TaxID=1183427 RepID=A0A1S7RPI1_9HYPH|nr:hypothetical protein AGR7C_Lc210005 [Agrobacterium deltaense Zutra 3/1]
MKALPACWWQAAAGSRPETGLAADIKPRPKAGVYCFCSMVMGRPLPTDNFSERLLRAEIYGYIPETNAKR